MPDQLPPYSAPVRGMGPIWLYVEQIVSKVIIIASHHLLVFKMPKKRMKNEENRFFS